MVHGRLRHLLVEDPLHLEQERLALLPVQLVALAAEEIVDLGPRAEGEGAVLGYEGLEPRGRIARDERDAMDGATAAGGRSCCLPSWPPAAVPTPSKVGCWHWLPLKQLAAERERWQPVAPNVTGFFRDLHIPPWNLRLRMMLYRRHDAHESPKSFQLDLFTPDDGHFEGAAVATNLALDLPAVYAFICGRGAQEKTIAELKGEFAFDVVPARHYGANRAVPPLLWLVSDAAASATANRFIASLLARGAAPAAARCQGARDMLTLPATRSTRGPGRSDVLTRGVGAGSHGHMQDVRAPCPPAAAGLLARIAQGDREAFSLFYDAFAGLALGLIRRVLRDPAASEEVLQEVFWQVWQDAGRYDPGRGSPEAWLVMRAKTRAIDRLRAIRRREKTFVAPVDDAVAASASDTPAENPGVAAERRGLVRSALDGLPEPQRRVVELAFFEGLTQSEIAKRLGEPLGTVNTRARLGLERLRSLVKREGSTQA